MKFPIAILILLGFFNNYNAVLKKKHEPEKIIDQKQVNAWAHRLGVELYEFAAHVTRLETIKNNFTRAEVKQVNPEDLLNTISKSIEDMMFNKISALKRIADTAERVASCADDNRPCAVESKEVSDVKYVNTNNITAELFLAPKNSHFYDLDVNTEASAIHVPTNVYDRSDEVLRVAKWSQSLNDIFLNNYQEDPSLSWQFFGSVTGALRVFPAHRWKQFQDRFAPIGREDDLADLFDCRVREWYINAAASPKDMIILLDNSGSMTGQRREIARHVVNNILDTLGNNDYVNILEFQGICKEVVPCFSDILVQANLANVRELKMGVESMDEATNIANFTLALSKAFQILQTSREKRSGAGVGCNQAIMIVTDGASENYKEVFEEWNWRGQNDSTKWPVRIFSYLVGKEISDYRDVKWMACANKGYYVHLSTLAEVRDQILSYVPVMARPLVLQGIKHPIVWTPIYADVTDPKLSDWLWELKECDEQRERSISYSKNSTIFKKTEIPKRAERILRKSYDQNSWKVEPYRLLTTVAMPAFDKRERIVPCYQVCAKQEGALPFEEPIVTNAFSTPVELKKVKVANLLGVAGIDVPDTEFKRALLPHVLGVNAYGFIVTNNGFILVHPELRSMFQGILKPSYNSVDLTDIEQVDDDRGPRDYNPKLLEMRAQIVMQKKNSMELPIKYQLDDMRRVSKCIKVFYYKGLKAENKSSPFTLVLAIPQPLGRARVTQTEELALLKKKINLKSLFHQNWTVHPEWFYCKYNVENPHYKFASAEKEVIHFIEKAMNNSFSWPPQMNIPPEKRYYKSQNETCDRDLFLSLIYDAYQTMSFYKLTDYSSTKSNDPRDTKDFVARFGLTIVFIATRSGLLRWKDNDELKINDGTEHFARTNNRAIDEVWYKRAVEQHYVDKDSFVFSVPFDAYGSVVDDTFSLDKKPRVTASHAIFVGDENKKAPIAVVGLQMLHSGLQTIFTNITSTTIYNKSENMIETCKSDNLDCFVLDNNGYIVVADEDKRRHTGIFFGMVHPEVMKSLVKTKVYKKITYYDHQAVCFDPERRIDEEESSSAMSLISPFNHMSTLINWSTGHILWYLVQFNLQWFGTLAYNFRDQEVDGPDDDEEEELEIIDDEEDEDDYVSIKSEAYDEMMSDQPVSSFTPVPTKEINDAKDTTVEPSPSEVVRDIIKINRTRPQPCDRVVDLYVLEPKVMTGTERSMRVQRQDCSRPYLLEYIPSTNLILIVINHLCFKSKPRTEPPFDTYPTPVNYTNGSMLCYKERSAVRLVRRPPDYCVNSHHRETNITQLCGGGSSVLPNYILLLVIIYCAVCSKGFMIIN